MKKLSYFVLCIGMITFPLLTACQSIWPDATADHGSTSSSTADTHAAHWSYEGEAGPDHWGALDPDNTACADGSAQSPIDLVEADGEDLTDITFHYGESHLQIGNNGHTVQVDYDKGSSIMIGDVPYELIQFHFHTASEHTIAGKHYPLELHLVHRNAKKELAVVGVMAVEGAENPAFTDILAHAPDTETPATVVEGVMVAAEALLPAERLYYAYEGSLTTPPCTEAVKWHVLTTPIELSAAQIEGLTHILHNNFRPVQPLHERTLVVDTTGG